MAVMEKPKTQSTAPRPDWAAISRRMAERHRVALTILERYDREGVPQQPAGKRD